MLPVFVLLDLLNGQVLIVTIYPINAIYHINVTIYTDPDITHTMHSPLTDLTSLLNHGWR